MAGKKPQGGTGRAGRDRAPSSGVKHVGRVSQELFDEWDRQIHEGWDGPRGGMAYAALVNTSASWSDMGAMVIEEDGELKAIAALRPPTGRYNFETGGRHPPEPGSQLVADYLASKERGYGSRMMRGMAEQAAANSWGLSFSATDASKAYYLKLGLRPTSEGSTLFSLTEGEVKRWLKTGKV